MTDKPIDLSGAMIVDKAVRSVLFEEHLSKIVPSRLNHYTNQLGLLGIVEREKLYATKVQYMNDATEFSLALDLAAQRIQDFKGRPGSELAKLETLFPRRRDIAQSTCSLRVFARPMIC
jgi:hypothetical protein